MEKRAYEMPVMQVERFIPNEYIAGCAKYHITLTCTWPTQNGGYTYGEGADGLQHGTGWGGGCTITINEFGGTESHGGTYDNNLTMNGTSLTDYADIRKYLEDKTEYSGTSEPTDDKRYATATWTSHDKTYTYKHKGYLTFTKETGEAANRS